MLNQWQTISLFNNTFINNLLSSKFWETVFDDHSPKTKTQAIEELETDTDNISNSTMPFNI